MRMSMSPVVCGITEPALDLAIIAALISSQSGRAIDEHTVIFGEVGLVGEVRAVPQAEKRVAEAIKTGYKTCILPLANKISIEKSWKPRRIRR